MWWNRRKKELEMIDQMRFAVASSFQKVKQDISKINEWLNFYYQKTTSQEQLIKSMQFQIQQIPKTPMQFKQIIDEIYHFEALEKRISELNSRIDGLYQPASHEIKEHIEHIEHIPDKRILELQQRLEQIEVKKQSFKDKIMKKIVKSSKDYIKSMIVSYIKKYEKISAFQLKEMVVDEQKLCSKSSFYRILEEIESEFEHDISTIKEGKEKHYMGKLVKRV